MRPLAVICPVNVDVPALQNLSELIVQPSTASDVVIAATAGIESVTLPVEAEAIIWLAVPVMDETPLALPPTAVQAVTYTQLVPSDMIVQPWLVVTAIFAAPLMVEVVGVIVAGPAPNSEP